jgi:hypothetical protein
MFKSVKALIILAIVALMTVATALPAMAGPDGIGP